MRRARGLIIAAPASGSGKTTVTLGLLRTLARSGMDVASFKVGPDYIDTAFHERALGRKSVNIDSWAMRTETLSGLFREAAGNCDLVIGEGVMGLYDGTAGGRGSTAETASILGLPIVLVVDARAQAQSAAALIHGFRTWDRRITVSGVIFNRVGSERHARLLREAVAPLDIAVLGCLPRSPELSLPSRHLGLVQASEVRALETILDQAADLISTNLDIPSLLALPATPTVSPPAGRTLPIRPIGQRIAVAADDAFRFSYHHVIEGWHRAGAEIFPFSPLADQPPYEASDAVYLPGGYPELHAARIAASRRFLDGLRKSAVRKAFVYGECGGYMVLGESLTDSQGTMHRMAGLLPLATSFSESRLHLGYREVTLMASCPLGPPDIRYRGHMFHYARILQEKDANRLFAVHDSSGVPLGPAGLQRGTVTGSFMHLIDSV